ncbi:MAG: hypothetical protein EWM72_03080 [Nitrospira sp.]|nr:MAG: hypothetical protein EWM72_03080 [Nitrospira sp.]
MRNQRQRPFSKSCHLLLSVVGTAGERPGLNLAEAYREALLEEG